MKRLKRIGMPLLTLLLVLAVWEGCVHVFDIDLYTCRRPQTSYRRCLRIAIYCGCIQW